MAGRIRIELSKLRAMIDQAIRHRRTRGRVVQPDLGKWYLVLNATRSELFKMAEAAEPSMPARVEVTEET
jgi:hypothetical protein